MSVVWDRVGPGRYATTVNGRLLQAMRNPDWTDSRRYIAVVDKQPLETPDWNLSGAKTRAIRAVLFDGHRARRKAYNSAAAERQPEAVPALEPAPELVPVLAPELGCPAVEAAPPPAAEPAPQPEPEHLGDVDPLALGELVAYAEPVEPAPQPAAPMSAVTATFTVEIATDDVAAAIANLRSMAELLREQGRVRCVIDLPPRIEL